MRALADHLGVLLEGHNGAHYYLRYLRLVCSSEAPVKVTTFDLQACRPLAPCRTALVINALLPCGHGAALLPLRTPTKPCG